VAVTGAVGEMLAEAPRECVAVGVDDTRDRDGVKKVGVTDGEALVDDDADELGETDRLDDTDGETAVALAVADRDREIVRVGEAEADRDTDARIETVGSIDAEEDAVTDALAGREPATEDDSEGLAVRLDDTDNDGDKVVVADAPGEVDDVADRVGEGLADSE